MIEIEGKKYELAAPEQRDVMDQMPLCQGCAFFGLGSSFCPDRSNHGTDCTDSVFTQWRIWKEVKEDGTGT